MPFQPATGIVQAEVRMVLDSQRVENVFHFSGPSSSDPVAIAALADALRISWTNDVLPIVSSALQLNSVYVRSLDAAIAPASESFPANAQVGGNTQPVLPSNVSWCLKFTTGLTGRSGRGRSFVVGLCENQVTANLIAAGTADDLLIAYQSFFATAAGQGWQPVVLSRVQGGDELPVALGYAITGVGFSDRVVDSQRRRLPQRGD